MSHEIRTPMNAIIGMSELLAVEKLSDRQLQQVTNIRVSATSLLGIVNDLLDFSKMEEGKFNLVPVHYNFYLMIENAASMMEYIAKEKGLDFKLEVPGNLPVCLYGDDMKMRQVLVNILSNAVKFTREGYVRFSIEVSGGNLKIDIQDTGIGIKPADVDRLFDPFEQVDEQKNRKAQGTGLGLAITNNIIKMMNGSIRISSRYGSGTTFHLTIPYVLGDESQIADDADDFVFISAPDAKVLLVDDVEMNLLVGSGFLKLCDIIPDTASSGPEALQKVQEKDYDIVFMDHMMPEMDGEEATIRIREMGGKYGKGEFVIIALTANATPDAKELLLSCGMDDFLAKPIDKAALNSMLKKWLPKEKQFELAQDNISEPGVEDYPPVIRLAGEIEGLDTELGLSRVNGAQDYERSLRLLERMIPKTRAELANYLENGELSRFAIGVHGMKGALAINGNTDLSNLAQALETEAKSGNTQFCETNFPDFSRRLKTFGDALSRLFDEPEPEKKAQGGKELLAETIENIEEAIESFDRVSALEEMESISDYTFGDETDKILNQVHDALEEFDFGLAAELLQGINP